MKTRHRAAQRAQTSKSRSGSSLRRTSTKTTAPTTHHAPPSTARRRGSRHAASPRTRPTSTEREAGKGDLMTACAPHLRASPDDDDRNLILTKPAETAFLGIPVAKKLVAPKKKQSLYMATPPVATQCYKTSQAPLYAANRPARTKKQTSAAIDPGARSPGGVAGVQLTPVNTSRIATAEVLKPLATTRQPFARRPNGGASESYDRSDLVNQRPYHVSTNSR